jgi:hypothetical protein
MKVERLNVFLGALNATLINMLFKILSVKNPVKRFKL